jgi:GNAT superfamily N-acetyltransferase
VDTSNPKLPLGYSPLPPNCTANVVTCLEMLAPPPARPAPSAPPGVAVERWEAPELDAYRALYRQVGDEWLWFSHLEMSDAELRRTLDDPLLEVYALSRDGERIGLLELDFREAGTCELLYFGIAGPAIGQGLGRLLMHHAIARAWAAPIRRFWVHTCTFDHPGAVAFYRRSGFRPYATFVEVHEDPRLTFDLPRDAAPHVPPLDGAG